MDVPRKRVLVVEDDPDASSLLRRLLQKFGYEVVEAPDPVTAISLVSARKPDLVCLDLCLSHGSGFDVCETMRANEEWASIPVLVTTARRSPQDRALAEMLGADGYLTKPFSSDVFMDVVERLVNRDRAVVPLRPEVQQ